MRRILALVLLSSLSLAPFGVSSPIGGSTAQSPELQDGVWTTTRTFRAGERACVLSIGNRDDAPNLEVTIRDAKGILIAEDKAGGSLVGNIVAVMWYPPHDGDYRIEVRNPESRSKKAYVVIK